MQRASGIRAWSLVVIALVLLVVFAAMIVVTPTPRPTTGYGPTSTLDPVYLTPATPEFTDAPLPAVKITMPPGATFVPPTLVPGLPTMAPPPPTPTCC